MVPSPLTVRDDIYLSDPVKLAVRMARLVKHRPESVVERPKAKMMELETYETHRNIGFWGL